MTETPSIAEFLTARYDEQEELANSVLAELGERAGGENPGTWETGRIYMTDTGTHTGLGIWFDDDSGALFAEVGRTMYDTADFIAAHDPARALAELAAKRAVVKHCAAMLDVAVPRSAMAQFCMNILVSLAMADADHADFNPDWRIAE